MRRTSVSKYEFCFKKIKPLMFGRDPVRELEDLGISDTDRRGTKLVSYWVLLQIKTRPKLC